MPLAVVVVSYRTPPRIGRCLEALEADQPGVKVYLADNASRPAELKALAGRHPHVVSLATGENPGFAVGVNRGVQRALEDGATHVLVMNDDVFVRPGALRRLEDAAGRAGVAAPYLAGRGDGEFHGGRIDWVTGIAGHEEGATDYLCAACLMISREAWLATGPFDEGYFLYYEDVDWCVRAAARGVALSLVPEELAWHDGGASTGGGGDPTVVYWWTRNRLRFVRKHCGYLEAAKVAMASIARGVRRVSTSAPEETPMQPVMTAPPHGALRRESARVRGLVAGMTTRIG